MTKEKMMYKLQQMVVHSDPKMGKYLNWEKFCVLDSLLKEASGRRFFRWSVEERTAMIAEYHLLQKNMND